MDCDDLESNTYTRDADMYGSNVSQPNVPSSPDSMKYVIAISTSLLDTSEIEYDFDDSDTDSESDVDSDSDSEDVQYITIPHQSPWWKPPASSNSSFDNTPDDTLEDESSEDDLPSGRSLQDVLREQQYLVAVFHDELRRTIPDDPSYVYNDEWLSAVDAKLLLAPVEVFHETCMDSLTMNSRPVSTDFEGKSIPDVPIDLENDGIEWEWVSDTFDGNCLAYSELQEQPLLTSRASSIEPRIVVDPHFGVQKVSNPF